MAPFNLTTSELPFNTSNYTSCLTLRADYQEIQAQNELCIILYTTLVFLVGIIAFLDVLNYLKKNRMSKE